MNARKFRKKPVLIEAVQFDGNGDQIVDWIHGNGGYAGRMTDGRRTHNTEPGGYLLIETLEGTMRADLRDWIIRGLAGEFYPCKPGIFEQSYEEVQ